mmetsp:Transcript_44340/g.112203  ORF Transcript_44340/g.112203 Transcript_44340/m.112203 type:complete len:246 (-) Transcript_44340:1798-2535(-)
MYAALVFTRPSTSPVMTTASSSATVGSSLKMRCRERSSSSAISSLYGSSRWHTRSRPSTARSTRGLAGCVARAMTASRCACTSGHSSSMRSRLRMVTPISSSRQSSAVSVSSRAGDCAFCPPGMRPAAQMMALTNSRRLSARRNLESLKTSSMRQASTQFRVACSASPSRWVGVLELLTSSKEMIWLMIPSTPVFPFAGRIWADGMRLRLDPSSSPSIRKTAGGSRPSLCTRTTQSSTLRQAPRR